MPESAPANLLEDLVLVAKVAEPRAPHATLATASSNLKRVIATSTYVNIT